MSHRGVVHGRVLAILPRALFRVALESGHEVIAHVVEGTEKNFVRLVVGDRVSVQLSANDSGRGRILRKVAGSR
jgi:translation initiation factor IF-1